MLFLLDSPVKRKASSGIKRDAGGSSAGTVYIKAKVFISRSMSEGRPGARPGQCRACENGGHVRVVYDCTGGQDRLRAG